MLFHSTYLKIFILTSSAFVISAQNDPLSENIEYTNSFTRLLRGRKPVAQPAIIQSVENVVPHSENAKDSVFPGIVRNVFVEAPTQIKIKIPDVATTSVPVIHDEVPQNIVPQTETNFENDPFLKELFKEFVAQYMQLAPEEKKDQETKSLSETTSTTFETTTTTAAPVKVSYIPTPNFVNQPADVQRSKTQIRRRKPINSTTQANIPENDTKQVQTQSLKHKYFGGNVEKVTETPKINIRQKFFGLNIKKKSTESIVDKIEKADLHRGDISPIEDSIVLENKTTEKPTIKPNLKALFNLRFAKPKIAIAQKPKEVVAKENTRDEEVTTKANFKYDEAVFKKQAESAKYEFASEIDDKINGHTHEREEVRDGLAVKGKYSFSDGYFMRTVHYEADDKGYRVVKEEVVPLDGPHYNPEGDARVSQYVAGSTNEYQITVDDIKKRNQKVVFQPVDVAEQEEFEE